MRTVIVAAAAVLASFANAQNPKRVTVTDAASAVPGMDVVETLPAVTPLPGTSDAPPPAQLAGFPIAIGAHASFSPWRTGVIEDLDRDGANELLVASTDSKLYCFRGNGAAFPGFPVSLIGMAQYAPSVVDLEGDGKLDIVQFTRGLTNGGRMYVLDNTGVVRTGFPISVNNQNLDGSPTCADLDDDGVLEILVPERAYPIGWLHVFEPDGTQWGGNWPVQLSHVPTGSPAVADVDLDGTLDIVYTSYDQAYLLHSDGTAFTGWPKPITNANFSYQSPALADLDNDGDLEIVLGTHGNAPGYHVYRYDGTLMPGWPKSVGTWTYVPPTVADFEKDGTYEILGGREGTGISPSAVLFCWTPSGAVKPGFPYYSFNPAYGGGCGGAIAVADVDGDAVRDVVFDHNVQDGSGLGWLFGANASGANLAGWPLRPTGFTYMNGPTFGDLNGDGNLDMVFLSTALPTAYVNAYDLGVPYNRYEVPWGAYHQDYDRSGKAGGGRTLFTQGVFTLGTAPSIVVAGKPGEVATVVLSLGTGNAPLPFGWWHLGQQRKRVIKSVVIPASGQVSQPLQLPGTPSLAGTPYYFQGVLQSGGGGRVTNILGRVLQ
jgi:hypothetical protein